MNSVSITWIRNWFIPISANSQSYSRIHYKFTILFAQLLRMNCSFRDIVHSHFSSKSLWIFSFLREFTMFLLSFSQTQYKLSFYYAKLLWIRYLFCQYTIISLSFLRIHYKFTIFLTKILWIHYLFPELRQNSLFLSLISKFDFISSIYGHGWDFWPQNDRLGLRMSFLTLSMTSNDHDIPAIRIGIKFEI